MVPLPKGGFVLFLPLSNITLSKTARRLLDAETVSEKMRLFVEKICTHFGDQVTWVAT